MKNYRIFPHPPVELKMLLSYNYFKDSGTRHSTQLKKESPVMIFIVFHLFATEWGIASEAQKCFSPVLEYENKAAVTGSCSSNLTLDPLWLIKQWEAESGWKSSQRDSV